MSERIEQEKQEKQAEKEAETQIQTPMTENMLNQIVPAKLLKDRNHQKNIIFSEKLRKDHVKVGQQYGLSKKKGVKITE